MKYFKIKIGYNDDDIIRIDETELEKAMYAFISGQPVVLKNAALNGKNIMAITEDYHRAMGWNYSYKLTSEDYADIKRILGDSYHGSIAGAKDRVAYLIQSGKTELIGQNVDIKQLN